MLFKIITKSYPKLILSDGTMLRFQFIDKTCRNVHWGTNGRCAEIHADLNGTKAPNTAGRDIFAFVLKEDGLYPLGCDDDSYCSREGEGNNGKGMGYACRVLQEGKIDY